MGEDPWWRRGPAQGGQSLVGLIIYLRADHIREIVEPTLLFPVQEETELLRDLEIAVLDARALMGCLPYDRTNNITRSSINMSTGLFCRGPKAPEGSGRALGIWLACLCGDLPDVLSRARPVGIETILDQDIVYGRLCIYV